MKQILHSFQTMLAVAALLCTSLQVNAVVFATGDCGAEGSNCKWYIESEKGINQLRISGTGRMADYAHLDDSPWFYAQPINAGYFRTDYVTRIVVEEGVTHIGSRAFCDFERVTKITLPNTVESIGDLTFYRNPALETLTLPSSTHLTSVGAAPITGCPLLSTITGADVIDNGWYTYPATELIAYPAASDAYSYTILDGCRLIRQQAFNFSRLYEVTLPASVEMVKWAVFDEPVNLTDIYAHPLTSPTYVLDIILFPVNSTKTAADINLHIHKAAYDSYYSTTKWSEMNIIQDLDSNSEQEGVEQVQRDKVQSTKELRNGTLIIRVGDKEYNFLGARM
ncbi:MAG: leucine-rich repeat protein [Paludibacteraceae bacterium]|nr:leucine-rich repeat protein [Paludibacteraceae bacterium]